MKSDTGSTVSVLNPRGAIHSAHTRTSHKSTAPHSIAVIGLGYVGLPLAILANARGCSVAGIDIDLKRQAQINTGTVPDLEEEFVTLLRKKPLRPSSDFSSVANAEIIIICVPTPVDSAHQPDLTPVMSALEGIAPYLRAGQLVILESTVHPGTCEEILIPFLEARSGLRAGKDFDVAHCPERINPGDTSWPVHRIPRVLGALTDTGRTRAASFYRSVLDASIYEMANLREAEAVKVVENSFRDINIAFVNELAMSFDKLGIDVMNVLNGAATKPFGFMPHYPGAGVGGHCIPVDPYYLIRYAEKNGFSHVFLSLARSINERMPAFTVDLAAEALKEQQQSLQGTDVALLGISYKPNISDVRESPSFEIEHILHSMGATVHSFDPHATEYGNTQTLDEALAKSDVVIIATAHDLFKKLQPHDFQNHEIRIVIDGRNCLQKELFSGFPEITYRGIGR